jgi:CHAD domain-containing protein
MMLHILFLISARAEDKRNSILTLRHHKHGSDKDEGMRQPEELHEQVRIKLRRVRLICTVMRPTAEQSLGNIV